MVEFLQSYGIWIFLGLMFLLMLRRGGGGCCGGGHHDQRQNYDEKGEGQPTGKGGSGCH